MNVIAYLNGEKQITDQSPCVCPAIRPIAIKCNDLLKNEDRHLMIPFIERAMGSATDDKAEIVRRAWLAVDLANSMKGISANAAYAAAHAAYAAADAANAANAAHAANAAYSAAAASATAAGAAEADDAASRKKCYEQIKAAFFVFLEAACPKQEQTASVVIARAEKLVAVVTDPRFPCGCYDG